MKGKTFIIDLYLTFRIYLLEIIVLRDQHDDSQSAQDTFRR
jgi:hypothetical protein